MKGPRTRAPLGMKTTNAKANAFKTPAPLSGSAKTQKLSPRLRRPKVKIHQPEVQDAEDDEVPEIEYMPPKEVPLPENYDEDMPPIDWNFPALEGANFTRGWLAHYENPIEDDGRTRGEREFEEGLARDNKLRDEKFDKMWSEMMAKEDEELDHHFGIKRESPKKPAPKAALPKQSKTPAPSTIKARSAAAALAPATEKQPSFAAPTAAAKSRLPSSILPGRKLAKPIANPSAARDARATAASRSTIGYAQGRLNKAAASPRKPLSNVTRPPPNPLATTSRRLTTASSATSRNGTTKSAVSARSRSGFSRSASTASDATLVTPEQEHPPTALDIENEMRLMMLDNDDDDDDEAWMESFRSQLGGVDPVDEMYEDFQLQLPTNI